MHAGSSLGSVASPFHSFVPNHREVAEYICMRVCETPKSAIHVGACRKAEPTFQRANYITFTFTLTCKLYASYVMALCVRKLQCVLAVGGYGEFHAVLRNPCPGAQEIIRYHANTRIRNVWPHRNRSRAAATGEILSCVQGSTLANRVSSAAPS